MSIRNRLPFWMQLLHTALMLAVVPAYWMLLGPGHLLWLSDVALLVLLPALWLENRLLISMMAVAVLPLEIGWVLSFVWGLIGDAPPFGLTAYMFDPEVRLLIRVLSGIFHVALPIELIWAIAVLGHDRRALRYQLPFTLAVLLAAWMWTDPMRNVNFVHAFASGLLDLAQPWHLLALGTLLALVFHLPTHLVLNRWRGREAIATQDAAPPAT